MRRRVQAGRLHAMHRGVYVVGHRGFGPEARWTAAALACGPGAGITGAAGARAWGLLRREPAEIEVVVPHGRRGPRAVRVVKARNLALTDITMHRGIPIASVALVLLHLAARGPAAVVESALREAQFLRIYDPATVEDLLDRSRGRPGVAALRALTEEKALTQSELERRMRALCRRSGLPQPVTQLEVVLAPDEIARVDFAWPEHRLIAETDGREGHLTPAAFEADRARDAALTALGWRVVRFTWRQVCARRHVVATLRATLA